MLNEDSKCESTAPTNKSSFYRSWSYTSRRHLSSLISTLPSWDPSERKPLGITQCSNNIFPAWMSLGDFLKTQTSSGNVPLWYMANLIPVPLPFLVFNKNKHYLPKPSFWNKDQHHLSLLIIDNKLCVTFSKLTSTSLFRFRQFLERDEWKQDINHCGILAP